MTTLHLDRKTNNYIAITLIILVIAALLALYSIFELSILSVRVSGLETQQQNTNKTLDTRGQIGATYFARLNDLEDEVSDIRSSIKNIEKNVEILAKRKNIEKDSN